MSENVERLSRGLEQFGRTGEIDPLALTDDFEVHQASSIIDTAGVFRGRNAIRDTLSELREVFDELRFEAETITEAPSGQVVAVIRVRARGRGSGIEMDNRIGWVFTFDGDKARRLVVYEEADEALKAAGLSEE